MVEILPDKVMDLEGSAGCQPFNYWLHSKDKIGWPIFSLSTYTNPNSPMGKGKAE